MGFLDALFGRKPQQKQQPAYTGRTTRLPDPQRAAYGLGATPGQLTDEQAIARYRYMIQTAPPEQIEQAHQEAFAKLTPEQRAQVLREVSQELPQSELAGLRPGQDDPQTLARLATRVEMRNPGYMERSFGPQSRYGNSMGGGGMMGTIFGSMVAGFVGSMAAMAIFDALDGGLADMPIDEPVADLGGEDMAAGDFGGDVGGDFGGEF
jgi:hypothetical protein